eukprot:m.274226 g.274226  ORF g.274226 m.274226 type:complete len:52 (+) comp15686_c1_seq15:67-222(+)
MCVFLLRFRILLLGLSFVHNTNEQDCIFAQTDKQTAHQLRVDSTLEGFPVH